MRIQDILTDGRIHLSCEIFPPKAFSGMEQAASLTREIASLHPDFISVTYGAAGNTPNHTLSLAQEVEKCGVTSLCHLTCLQSTREQVTQVLDQMQTAGMENVLALRGDMPKEGAPAGDFTHAADLIRFIKARGSFCVGAACYPEGHPESVSRQQDLDYVKAKVDAGADFLTTQMFFDNAILYNFLFRALRRGIRVPVVAGIMPITDTRLPEAHGAALRRGSAAALRRHRRPLLGRSQGHGTGGRGLRHRTNHRPDRQRREPYPPVYHE